MRSVEANSNTFKERITVRVNSSKSKGAAVMLQEATCAATARPTVKKGDVFIRSWMIDRMPSAVQLEETQYESWVDESRYDSWWVATNADADKIEHELVPLGWLFFPTKNVIEASAFGCDSSVSERALSRVLQKAADQDITAVEIADMTVEQNSCITYVSMLALPRELQEYAVLGSARMGACFLTRELKDSSLAT